MLTTILFDADGVLINGKQFSAELEKDFVIPTSETELFFTTSFPDCLVGQADLKERLQPYLTQWGWGQSVDALLQYWFETEHSLNQPLIDFVQTLRQKGISCVVTTNQEHYRAQYMINEMGFGEKFDLVLASADLGSKKPDLVFFEKVWMKIGQPTKSEVLFWDDATSNVKAGKAFGFKTEHYTDFENFKTKMSEYL